MTDCAFQNDAFQNDAFQVCVPAGGGASVVWRRPRVELPLDLPEDDEALIVWFMEEEM